MDVVVGSPKDGKTSKHANFPIRKGRNICFAVVLGILGFVILLVILGFTVFKAKRTVTTVRSISIKGLRVSLDIPTRRVDLNLTLNVDLSVDNPNKVGFKYGNGYALLHYRGDLVGEVVIPAGKISPGETHAMNTTLTVFADRLLSNSNAYSDVISVIVGCSIWVFGGAVFAELFLLSNGNAMLLSILFLWILRLLMCATTKALLVTKKKGYPIGL
ncbi:hypothetical protein HHK36_018719 [Tetracentron sinense]|uniref:Late embryogenesis abundant protein LEA-2 subgroup domain-containing protein n=1 Tax=Tetracentron sinense TaxID=13715 RepID=A0A835D8X0_TETSI|nr:hypothetical protein HHK36_018719 [Tetracentron sinense]